MIMLTVNKKILDKILSLYGICGQALSVEELLRYDCEVGEQDREELRLILKVSFGSKSPVVIKFRGGCEGRNARPVIAQQTEFADCRLRNCIPTSRYYKSGQNFAVPMRIEGYDTVITVEDYVENEITAVDEQIAQKTGSLLAMTHNISEQFDFHIENPVIFDPFNDWNDLFDFESFYELAPHFASDDKVLFERICDAYHAKKKLLEPLRQRKRYAVQGDLSDCNTFLSANGEIGLFDFNCGGDTVLFGDAVMQGWFVAHLMNYTCPQTEEYSRRLFESFMDGYRSRRSISEEEEAMIPAFYSLITAFDCRTIRHNEKNLCSAAENGDGELVSGLLQEIWRKISE
ncbi:MAG: hypothetical protein K2N94_11690 [Lachnospiraceae bacterium]|nr:hypothetical protein [Lachnospiraceae bacterium]